MRLYQRVPVHLKLFNHPCARVLTSQCERILQRCIPIIPFMRMGEVGRIQCAIKMYCKTAIGRPDCTFANRIASPMCCNIGKVF